MSVVPTALRITVNGTAAECPEGLSVEQLLEYLNLPVERVAVERNRQIVPREARSVQQVQRDDVFEIVTFVGGG